MKNIFNKLPKFAGGGNTYPLVTPILANKYMKKQIYLLLLLITHVYFLQAQNIPTNHTDSLYKKNLLQYNPFNLKEKKWSVEVDLSKPMVAIMLNKINQVIEKSSISELKSNIQSYKFGITKINPFKNSEMNLFLHYANINSFQKYSFIINSQLQYELSSFLIGASYRKYFKKSNFFYSKLIGIVYTFGDEAGTIDAGSTINESNYKNNISSLNFIIGGSIGFKKTIFKNNFFYGFEISPLISLLDVRNYKNNNNNFSLAKRVYFDFELLKVGYIFK